MQDTTSYFDDPRRLAAAELLGALFSPESRTALQILDIAKQVEKHPGIGFFKSPVPYDIKVDSNVIRSGFTDSMRRAISSIIADLEALSPDALVVVDIDATRIPKMQPPAR